MKAPGRDSLVIIGAGQAAGELAASLRADGYSGSVTIVGTEPHLPYTRPPLSKAYLKGESLAEELYLRSASFYDEHDITVRTGVSVVSIDIAARTATGDDGLSYSWDKIVFATGGRPRRIPDRELETASNVHYVRTLADIDRLRRVGLGGARFAVIGGGYLGLEVAAVLRRLGAEVTVIEAADRLLARVTTPVVSEFFRKLHAAEGVDVRLGAQVQGYAFEKGDVTSVALADGSHVPVDQVLIGIGMIPNDDVAQAAGLDVDNGIIVDEYCRASAPDVYAIGDVARHPDPQNGGLRRLESMPNAASQARIVADDLLGNPRPYLDVPWFWSDQYETKLQAAGSSVGCEDVVVRGDQSSNRFAVLYLKNGRLCGVDAISSPSDYANARKLIAVGGAVSADELRDESVSLRSLLARAVATQEIDAG